MIRNYNEQHVAVMALTNILTGIEVLTSLECVFNSAFLTAHTKLIENSIGTLADNLTDSTDGCIGSNLINVATNLIASVDKYDSDSDAIKKNAFAALDRLRGKLAHEEYDTLTEKATHSGKS